MVLQRLAPHSSSDPHVNESLKFSPELIPLFIVVVCAAVDDEAKVSVVMLRKRGQNVGNFVVDVPSSVRHVRG